MRANKDRAPTPEGNGIARGVGLPAISRISTDFFHGIETAASLSARVNTIDGNTLGKFEPIPCSLSISINLHSVSPTGFSWRKHYAPALTSCREISHLENERFFAKNLPADNFNDDERRVSSATYQHTRWTSPEKRDGSFGQLIASRSRSAADATSNRGNKFLVEWYGKSQTAGRWLDINTSRGEKKRNFHLFSIIPPSISGRNFKQADWLFLALSLSLSLLSSGCRKTFPPASL